MTLKITVEVKCNYCGTSVVAPEPMTGNRWRSLLVAAGWVSPGNTTDFCPDHRTREQRAAAPRPPSTT